MKKYLINLGYSIVAALIILFAAAQYNESVARLVSGVVGHNHSSATGGGILGPLTINDKLSSTKSCASGYTRVSPNECRISDLVGFTTNIFTRDACTTIAAPAVDATAIILKHHLYIRANNAVALRFSQLLRWDSATCASNTMGLHVAHMREMVATGIGADLNRQDDVVKYYLPSNGSSLFMQFLDDAGNQGAAEYIVLGYTD